MSQLLIDLDRKELGYFKGRYCISWNLKINTHSMSTYVLLDFQHKNDVTIIVKLLCRAVLNLTLKT